MTWCIEYRVECVLLLIHSCTSVCSITWFESTRHSYILPYPGFHYHCLTLIDKWRPEHNWGRRFMIKPHWYIFINLLQFSLCLYNTCRDWTVCIWTVSTYLLKQQVLSLSFPSSLFLMKLNKGYINVCSRPHQKQDYGSRFGLRFSQQGNSFHFITIGIKCAWLTTCMLDLHVCVHVCVMTKVMTLSRSICTHFPFVRARSGLCKQPTLQSHFTSDHWHLTTSDNCTTGRGIYTHTTHVHLHVYNMHTMT